MARGPEQWEGGSGPGGQPKRGESRRVFPRMFVEAGRVQACTLPVHAPSPPFPGPSTGSGGRVVAACTAVKGATGVKPELSVKGSCPARGRGWPARGRRAARGAHEKGLLWTRRGSQRMWSLSAFLPFSFPPSSSPPPPAIPGLSVLLPRFGLSGPGGCHLGLPGMVYIASILLPPWQWPSLQVTCMLCTEFGWCPVHAATPPMRLAFRGL